MNLRDIEKYIFFNGGKYWIARVKNSGLVQFAYLRDKQHADELSMSTRWNSNFGGWGDWVSGQRIHEIRESLLYREMDASFYPEIESITKVYAMIRVMEKRFQRNQERKLCAI